MNTDYYSVLEAWPSSSDKDIKRNYFRLAKLYHPDVADANVENKERFTLINEAFAVLSNKTKRYEYNESLRNQKKGSIDSKAIKENDLKSASLAFMQAKESMRNGFYDKAVLLLKSAVRFCPDNPAYLSWYGFCVAMTNSNLHEARDSCKKAVQIEFYNADYHANLGFVYFKAGLKNQAIKYFQDALKWDPKNAVAGKFLFQLSPGTKTGEGPITKMFSTVKNLFIHSG